IAGVLFWASFARADLLGVNFDTGELVSVSTANAALTHIGNTGIASMGALEFAPDGTLYGFTVGPTSTLYSINPVTAAATLVGPLGQFTFEGALAFAPGG